MVRGFLFRCSNCRIRFRGYRHKTSKSIFCSQSCYKKRERNVDLTPFRDSKVPLNYGGSDNFLRKHIKPLLPKSCHVCNEKKALEIHHKNGNRKDNRFCNLMVLCLSHHRRLDNRINNIPKNRINSNPSYYIYEEYNKSRDERGRFMKWDNVIGDC